jgi:hypothetical protein
MSQEADIKIITDPTDFFKSAVEEAVSVRRVTALPLTKKYLVDLLGYYLVADNLFETSEDTGRRKNETLAELYLKAGQADAGQRIDMLKKLGDMSLYISGFFGDSLNRKTVDIDYYARMGEVAYATLAGEGADRIYSPVFREFSKRFLEYVDVLTYISQQSLIHSDEDLLRLYDRYVATGSRLAEEQLLEKGMLHAELKRAKGNKQ